MQVEIFCPTNFADSDGTFAAFDTNASNQILACPAPFVYHGAFWQIFAPPNTEKP